MLPGSGVKYSELTLVWEFFAYHFLRWKGLLILISLAYWMLSCWYLKVLLLSRYWFCDAVLQVKVGFTFVVKIADGAQIYKGSLKLFRLNQFMLPRPFILICRCNFILL